MAETNAFGDPIIPTTGWTTDDEILAPAIKTPGPKQAQDLAELVFAGVQSSGTGLAVHRKLPNYVLPGNASWHQRLVHNAANVAADIPLSILAGTPAFAVGGAAAGPPGAVVAAGAAGFAAPMALREALMTAYSQDHARSWSDVWEIAKSAFMGGGKGALIGGATLGAGRAVAPLVAGAGVAARVGVPLAAELGTLTTTAAVLEGHVPTAQDFLDNAILLGGMKGAVHVAGKLRQTYVETGKPPSEVAGEALSDPALKAALLEEPGPLRPGESRMLRLPEGYEAVAVEQRVKAALGDDPRPEMIRAVLDEAARKEPKGFDEILTELAPVKMEYLTSEADLAAFSRATEVMFRDEINVQTRGEVPAIATIHEAIKKMSGGLDPHKIGDAENAPALAARAFTFRAASAEAMKVIRDQAAKPETERTTLDNLAVYAALERANMAYRHLRGAAAETARSLNILRQIKYRPDLMPEAKALEAMFEKSMSSNAGQKLTFGDIAQMAATLKDPARLALFASKIEKATKMEMVIEGWKAAILSGPQTHMANMMGNMAKFLVEVPETALTTTITATRRALQGDAMSFAEYKAKALSPLHGLRWGARDSLTIAWEALKGRGGEHLEKADVYRTAIPGQAGHVIRTPFRLLQAEDVLFRTTAERGRAYELATERTINEGFKAGTREFNERVAQYTMQPELGLTAEAAGKALADIQAAGAEAVFASRLGPTMEKIQGALAGTPAQFVVPFIRTPVNLLSWSVQHSPGFLLSARWREDFAAGGARRDRAVARVVVGTGLMLTAAALFDEEILTGGGHFDKEQRRTKMGAGWQPYSIKIGDTYYSYQRLEPVGKVLGLVADLAEMGLNTDDDDGTKRAMAGIALFGNATISTTYLSGLAGVFNAATDPARYFESWYEQYAASLVPKVVGQTAQLADPHKREVNGMVDSIQSQIPFLREKLLPARDVWGEPKANNKWLGVLPVATSQESKDLVKSEAMRLELAIADIPKAMFESGPLKAKERKIEYTPEQRDVAREVSGKWAMSILAPIVNGDDWKSIPDYAKAEVFKDVLQDAKALGREAALPASSEVREKMRQKIVNEINRQATEAAERVK